MKFISQFLTLIAASSALSYSVKIEGVLLSDSINNIFKRQLMNISPECQQETETVKEFQCLGVDPKLGMDNYVTLCPYILSDECKKFYEDPSSYFNKCKNEPEFQSLFSAKSLDMIKKVKELNCAIDGNGELCPGAEATLKGELINENVVFNSCKSKKCFTALNNALTSFVDNLDDAVEEGTATKSGDNFVFPYLKELLNSPICTKETKDDTNSGNTFKTPANNSANQSSDGNQSSDAVTNMTKLFSSVVLAIVLSVMYF
ncbi:hypothetical protein BCR36DRAFT_586837 [Piromyces finnis]|uniref:Extracellular membrane protein CFEM domain-containing protein n=1 Tax=Piromyces finnis TaxID=1754191 RepID=A0A1Y1UZY4_9FUNG|nr:hypothetical protein BCR36DRAFT_586837 [Piromyces finnis]|eukprot:ORX43046.1 hypothetical protein BCR36DRAFT_586837 [Piromyces finnis]